MKKCPYCGAELNDDCLFCPECGKRMDEVPQATSPEPTKLKCPHCGASMNEGDAFCPNCGKSINEVSAEHSEEQESQQASDVSEKSTSKKYLPIIVGVIVLAILGGGWWSYKSSMEKKNVNLDSLFTVNLEEVKEDVEGNDTELIKDAFNNILNKCSSNTEFDDLGTYFLYDITGDNIPELWVYANDGTDSNFHIYTFKDKQAISIYKDSFEPSRTSFMNGKSGIYISTGGMGYEEWSLFKYENGKIVKKEVYSWSQNPANYEEVEESGVKPECEDIKTYKIKDKTPLDKIGNGSTLIEVKTDNGNADNSDGGSFKQYSDYVGTWKLNRTESGQKMRIEVTLKENHSGEFVVFLLKGSHDEVLVFENYPKCILTDGVIYLTKNGDITRGDVPKLKAASDGLYSFDNEKYVRDSK